MLNSLDPDEMPSYSASNPDSSCLHMVLIKSRVAGKGLKFNTDRQARTSVQRVIRVSLREQRLRALPGILSCKQKVFPRRPTSDRITGKVLLI